MQKLWGKRGKFLTIVLVFSLLNHIFYVLRPINHLADYLGFLNTEIYIVTNFLIHIIILYGLWQMKKWAFYLWCLDLLIWTYLFYLTYSHVASAMPNILAGFLVLAVLLLLITIGLPMWAIKRKWKDFS